MLGSRSGEWYYPNGTQVPVEGIDASFYRTRRDSGTNVLGGALLNRRNDAMGPTGIYNCVILDPNGDAQTLYVGLYTVEELATTTVTTIAEKSEAISTKMLTTTTIGKLPLTTAASTVPTPMTPDTKDQLPTTDVLLPHQSICSDLIMCLVLSLLLQHFFYLFIH